MEFDYQKFKKLERMIMNCYHLNGKRCEYCHYEDTCKTLKEYKVYKELREELMKINQNSEVQQEEVCLKP